MDQLSEIQTADMPQPPAPSGNARADSLARVEYEKQLTAYFEQREQGFQPRGAIPAASIESAPPSRGVQPNADDLEALKAAQADAMKRFPGNSRVLAIIDEAYRDTFSGKRLDFEALNEALGHAVETAEDREVRAAVEQLSAAVDANGAISHDKIPARLMCGYSLPPGLYDAEETVAGLKLAAELGLSQSQLDRYIELQRDA